jgi:hypothetical protein
VPAWSARADLAQPRIPDRADNAELGYFRP